MADVPMTRAEAVKLIEAHEHVVRRWAGAHHDKIEEAADEQLQSREALITALTRPAPSPSDVELEARANASIERIGKMCSELRPPKMSIPADRSRDDDLFIIDTIKDLLARMRGAAVPEWRDIKTDPPPSDGFFLAWSPQFPDMATCWRADIFHSARMPGTPKHLSANHWTHWMPVPAAPEVPR